MSEEYPPLPDWVQAVELVGIKIFLPETVIEGAIYTLPLTTGTNQLDGGAVPAGKVWKITQAAVQYGGTVTNVVLHLYAWGLAAALPLLDVVTPKRDIWYPWSGEIYLQAGDYMRLWINGATAGDYAYFRYAGVEMSLV